MRIQLSSNERECGARLDAWLAAFAGVAPSLACATVFAVLARQLGAHGATAPANPYEVEGAGWAGFSGFAAPDSRIATFETLDDGCRAAAVVLHDPAFAAVCAAHVRRDALGLAAALESSDLATRGRLDGLARAAALALAEPHRTTTVVDVIRRVLTVARARTDPPTHLAAPPYGRE